MHRAWISSLGAVLLFVCQAWTQQTDPSASGQKTLLTAEQIVQKMEERNLERASALRKFQGTRIYRMQYRGFPSDRDAEMVVNLVYRAPDIKEFSVVSQSGSKFVIDHVFKKLLEGEQEAANEENRQRTALTSTNYNFALERLDETPAGTQYVLDAVPKTKNKYLYQGEVWIDARDFAVTRIQAQPAKSPSFWIKKSEIQHRYIKIGDFWLPAENHTESSVRLGGKAVLSIEYGNYEVLEASSIGGSHENARVLPPHGSQ